MSNKFQKNAVCMIAICAAISVASAAEKAFDISLLLVTSESGKPTAGYTTSGLAKLVTDVTGSVILDTAQGELIVSGTTQVVIGTINPDNSWVASNKLQQVDYREIMLTGDKGLLLLTTTTKFDKKGNPISMLGDVRGVLITSNLITTTSAVVTNYSVINTDYETFVNSFTIAEDGSTFTNPSPLIITNRNLVVQVMTNKVIVGSATNLVLTTSQMITNLVSVSHTNSPAVIETNVVSVQIITKGTIKGK